MKLLVAVDGSPEADDAVAYAVDVAAATDGSITVAYAVDPTVIDLGGSQPVSSLSDAERRLVVEDIEDAENRGLAVLEGAAELASELGRDVETELLHGDPVVAITDYAEDGGFDTIVVGHRGRSERVERLLGSVAKGVVERTTVTVTVVR